MNFVRRGSAAAAVVLTPAVAVLCFVAAPTAPGTSSGAQLSAAHKLVQPAGHPAATAGAQTTLVTARPDPNTTLTTTSKLVMAARTTTTAKVRSTTTTVKQTTSRTTKPATSPFVTRCGTGLCLAGKPWSMFAASDYGTLGTPDAESVLANEAGVNTIRIVNFLNESGSPSTAPFDAATWAQVDQAIASAKAHNLHVELDLSTYRNLLLNAGLNPYTTSWESFLSFVAHRRNTVTGVVYANDPTIALVAIAGEPAPINTPSNTLGVTTAELTDFYNTTMTEWKSLDPNHLVTTGGFLQLTWNSGIDWQSIMKLSSDDVCDIHVYSTADQTITLPAVASLCASIGKPWITEEFGFPISLGDAARAAVFNLQFSLQRQYGAAGVGFWNLGPQTDSGSYDVGPSEPLTFAAVQAEGSSLR